MGNKLPEKVNNTKNTDN